jgi:tetratricopeptide (TPR) repeat protein
LGKFVFPLELSVLAVAQDTWLWPGVLALLVVAVVWQRKIIARENVVLAIVSYGFMMLPNLSASSKLVLENRLYLPLVPIVGLATLAFSAIDGRRERRLLVGGAVLAVLAGQTLSYLGAFRDRRSFALAAVRGSPHSSLAHKNLGLTFHAVGKIEKAEREYRTALQLDPSEPMAHNNLGTIWGARKQLAVAEREFRAEIAVNPTYAPAHHNLAALLHATHRDDEAVTHWQASLDTNHRDSTATRALYAYYASRGDSRAAQYKQLLEANSKPSLR